MHYLHVETPSGKLTHIFDTIAAAESGREAAQAAGRKVLIVPSQEEFSTLAAMLQRQFLLRDNRGKVMVFGGRHSTARHVRWLRRVGHGNAIARDYISSARIAYLVDMAAYLADIVCRVKMSVPLPIDRAFGRF